MKYPTWARTLSAFSTGGLNISTSVILNSMSDSSNICALRIWFCKFPCLKSALLFLASFYAS